MPISVEYQLKIIDALQDCCLEGHRFCSDSSHYYYTVWKPFRFHGEVVGQEHTAKEYADLADYLIQKVVKDTRSEGVQQEKESMEALRSHANTWALRMQGARDRIRKDEYRSKSSYVLIGLGRCPITHRNAALIRVPSTRMRILVYLSYNVANNTLKKIMESGTVLPDSTTHRLLCEVVDEFWAGVKTPKWTLTELSTI